MGGTYYSSVGVFLPDPLLVCAADVTNHLCAKLLGQHFGARCTQLAPKHGG